MKPPYDALPAPSANRDRKMRGELSGWWMVAWVAVWLLTSGVLR